MTPKLATLRLQAISRRWSSADAQDADWELLQEVRKLLGCGADVHAPYSTSEHTHEPTDLLCQALGYPQVAQLLLVAGVPITQRVVGHLLHMQRWGMEQCDALHQVVIDMARRAPQLDWHVPHERTDQHLVWPASSFIEQLTPGFNDALEQAQARGGLPVGNLHLLELFQDKEAAIGELCSTPQPKLFHLGRRARAQVFEQLWDPGMDPDMRLPGRRRSLLEEVLAGSADVGLVRALIGKGATVEFSSYAALLEHVFFDHPGVDQEIESLVRALMEGGTDPATLEPARACHWASAEDLLRDKFPKALAAVQGSRLGQDTPSPSTARTGNRL